jgi:Fe-S cluster assembly ATP-binding protein
MLEIKNLKVEVDKKEVLKGVDFNISQGEIVALMGPNGSGKSSLAYALMGHPHYLVSGELRVDNELINGLTPDERAERGLFLASQYPAAVPGVRVGEIVLACLRSRERKASVTDGLLDKKVSALELRRKIEAVAKKMDLTESLLKRGINDGFSGGEKKKMEVLQMLMLKPKYAILDETDSGLDIDALKLIAKTVRQMVKKQRMGILVITHYRRLLDYLVPDRVLVMRAGKIVKEGGVKLVGELEEKGYKFM